MQEVKSSFGETSRTIGNIYIFKRTHVDGAVFEIYNYPFILMFIFVTANILLILSFLLWNKMRESKVLSSSSNQTHNFY